MTLHDLEPEDLPDWVDLLVAFQGTAYGLLEGDLKVPQAIKAEARMRELAEQLLLKAAQAVEVARHPPVTRIGPLSGGQVRAVVCHREAFTIGEVCSELDCKRPELMKFLTPMLLGGLVRETGQRFARQKVYEYVPPQDDAPRSRPRRTPPERNTDPAYSEARATGMPVRVPAMARLTRQGRSTGGLAHFHRMRDKRYAEMQEAIEKRAQSQSERAQVQARTAAEKKAHAKKAGRKRK